MPILAPGEVWMVDLELPPPRLLRETPPVFTSRHERKKPPGFPGGSMNHTPN